VIGLASLSDLRIMSWQGFHARANQTAIASMNPQAGFFDIAQLGAGSSGSRVDNYQMPAIKR
jgi:hypothetical protein